MNILHFWRLVPFVLILAFMPAPASAAGYFEPYEVENTMHLDAGDIIVDTKQKKLFFAYDDEIVIVYPVAVGRDDSAWRGRAEIRRIVDGPTWHPTASQKAKKKLPDAVPPGPRNPLGKFAFYLFDDHGDTLIRIHGTNVPSSIGKAVSDGCIRMRNEHIEELYEMVEVGAEVLVR